MSENLKYSLRVWLGAGIGSPLLYVLFVLIVPPHDFSHLVLTPDNWVTFGIIITLLFSLPSCLLFFLMTIYVSHSEFSQVGAKVVLSLVALALCYISLAVLVNGEISFLFEPNNGLILTSAYFLGTTASVWFFTFRGSTEKV